jgi:hypothetical protein
LFPPGELFFAEKSLRDFFGFAFALGGRISFALGGRVSFCTWRVVSVEKSLRASRAIFFKYSFKRNQDDSAKWLKHKFFIL